MFNVLCQKISLSRRTSFFLSVSKCSFLICSAMEMVTLLSKFWVHVSCKKCSVSSQLLIPFLIWFLWLFNRRLMSVNLLKFANATIDYVNDPLRMVVHCMKYGKRLLVCWSGESCGLVDLIAPTALHSFTCCTPLWYQIKRCLTYKAWTHKSVS